MQGWLKAKQAGRYASVSERTIRTWLSRDGLRHVKVRGTILIKKEWLDAFLMSFEVDSGANLDGIVDEVMKGLNN